MEKMSLLGIFLLLNSVALAADSAGEIKVVMTDFRIDKGNAKIALFNSKEGFPYDNKKALKLDKVKIKNEKAETVFKNISYGIYAIAVYHDENDNNKFDENWLGIPREGYGTSNNVNPAMRAPDYDEAKFELNSRNNEIHIIIKY